MCFQCYSDGVNVNIVDIVFVMTGVCITIVKMGRVYNSTLLILLSSFIMDISTALVFVTK